MAKVYYAITPTEGAAAGWTRYAQDAMTVYDLIMELKDDHLTAANAEGWAELSCIGESYEGEGFAIEVIED